MSVIFTKTFTRENTNTNWPTQIREIDAHITLEHPSCTSWRVTSFSDDGLSFTYVSTWTSIEELQAALEDDVVLNNADKIDVYCNDNGITTTYMIT
jgi:hypothetical protein